MDDRSNERSGRQNVRRPAARPSLHSSRSSPLLLQSRRLSASGVPTLHAIVDSGRNGDLHWSDFTPYKTEVAKLYETNGYSLLWVQNGRVRPQGLAVIELLQNADAKGLDPEDYDGSRWQDRLLKLGQKPSEQDLVSFDTALTVSAMRYIRAIHCGRVNPKEFKFQLDMGGEPLPLAEFIQTQIVNASDPAAEIQNLEPPFLGYRKLLALLPVYEGYAKQDDGKNAANDHEDCAARPNLRGRGPPGVVSSKSSATFLQARQLRSERDRSMTESHRGREALPGQTWRNSHR